MTRLTDIAQGLVTASLSLGVLYGWFTVIQWAGRACLPLWGCR